MSDSLGRREMILGSGILLAGLAQSGNHLALGAPGVSPQVAEEKDLVFRTTDPRNAEPALNKLIASWITPTSKFYVRSHAPNPKIDEDTFRLKVEGMVNQPLSLSMKQLKGMQATTITATLTCAGNRRVEFNKEGKVGGVQWESGAIGNATWSGVALSKVLNLAGVQEGTRHVWFEGLDQIPKGGKVIPFGASVPIEKAMTSKGEVGTLLAYNMNGEKLLPDHGFPLRTLVPGYIGARSVKWLGKIVVSDRTSPNHYLATAYKLVKKTDAIDWQEAGPIYRYLINAAVGSHEAGVKLKAGEVDLGGYVLPSGILGARIKRVLVSTDDQKKWVPAELTGEDADYCWQLWKAKLNVTKATREIVVRAQDSAGGFMPPRVPWNAKGYLQNSWFRLPVEVTS